MSSSNDKLTSSTQDLEKSPSTGATTSQPDTPPPAKPAIVPPDGGTQAWLQVLSSFLVNINNWGLVYSYGIYQQYYQSTLLPHQSVTDIAWIGTIQGSFLLIFGTLFGPLCDRGYLRPIFIGASITLVFALMMLSLATQYYQIVLAQGILLGICFGALYVPSIATLPQYFTKRRGTALAFATSGGSVGGVIYPIIFRRLLDEVGLAWATRIIGFIALTTLSIAIALLRPLGPTKRPTRQLLDNSAFKEIPFMVFLISGFFQFAGFLVPFFFLSDFSLTVGASTDLAFYLVAVINAAAFFGRILSGVFADYVGPEVMLAGALFSLSILGFAWIGVQTLAGYIVLLAIYGFFGGMMATLSAAQMPYLCPSIAVYGTRVGMVYGAAGVGVLIGAPSAAALSLDSGGFLGAQLWMGCTIMLSATLFSIFVVPHVRKKRLQAVAAKAKAFEKVERRRTDTSTIGDDLDAERQGSLELPVIPSIPSIFSEWMEYSASFELTRVTPRSSVRFVSWRTDDLKISTSRKPS